MSCINILLGIKKIKIYMNKSIALWRLSEAAAIRPQGVELTFRFRLGFLNLFPLKNIFIGSDF